MFHVLLDFLRMCVRQNSTIYSNFINRKNMCIVRFDCHPPKYNPLKKDWSRSKLEERKLCLEKYM